MVSRWSWTSGSGQVASMLLTLKPSVAVMRMTLGGERLAGLPEEECREQFDGVPDQDAKGDGGLLCGRVVGIDDDRFLIEAAAVEGLEGDVDFAGLAGRDGRPSATAAVQPQLVWVLVILMG